MKSTGAAIFNKIKSLYDELNECNQALECINDDLEGGKNSAPYRIIASHRQRINDELDRMLRCEYTQAQPIDLIL